MTLKMTTLRKCAIAAIGLLTAAQAFAGNPPKREFRSAWLATVWAIDWPKESGQSARKTELNAYLDVYESINATGICFQVRGMADAMYQSNLAPWSQYISGTRGTSPGWDPLAYAVEQCHARGLECYAWLNPYRWSSTGTIPSSTSFDKDWKNKGWALSNGSYVVLNPAKEEVRKHIVDVCREIVDNYAIDGFLFDDYFYPSGGTAEDNSAGDYSDYQAYKKAGGTMSFGDWRRDNVRKLMKDLRQMLSETRPDVRFGVGPAGVAGTSSAVANKYGVTRCPVAASDWQYGTIYSDPLSWLYDGTIDFISPQIYWKTTHATAPYGPLAKWWAYVADHFGRHFYSSHSLSYLSETGYTNSNITELGKQIQLNRDYETGVSGCGSVFYSAKHVKNSTELSNYLKNNHFQRKSLIPVVDWKEHPTYGAPTNAKKSGSTLTWTKVTNGKAIIRYSIYAIPSSLGIDDVQDANGDGINGEYLLGVSYNNNYTLPSDKASGYWYAVCVYDGYGYEYEPAFIGYTAENTPAVTLISPAEGAKVDFNATFKWSDVGGGANYTLFVAADKACSQPFIEKNMGTATSTTVDLGDRGSEEILYWCVKAQQPGKLTGTSEIRSCVTPPYDNAQPVTLKSPANGSEVGETVKFEWSKSANATDYTIQVASDSYFTSLKYSDRTTATTISVAASRFGVGTHYWRVIADGKRLVPASSPSRNFVIKSLPIGNYEPGYTIKRDPAQYAVTNNVKITNLWVRSVKKEYDNISFPEEGKHCRSLAALGDFVYVMRRAENSTNSQCYLDKYDGSTGELIETITVGDITAHYLPGNTLVRDDAGHLVSGNMTLNIGTNPLKLHIIDPATGEATLLDEFSFTGLTLTRVDHFDVYGDVTSGNYYVFAAVANSKSVIRWMVKDNIKFNGEIKTVNSVYPSSESVFGIAPRIHAISADQFYANGMSVNVARYSFSSGKMVGSFNDNISIKPVATQANGSLRFILSGKYFTVYPSSDFNGTNGFRMGVLVADKDDFASMKAVADIPKGGIGSVESATAAHSATPIDVIISEDGKTARVYFMVAGNGIAAYDITIDTGSIVNDLDINSERLFAKVNGMTITLNRAADLIELYNAAGVLIAKAADAASVEAPTPGVYLIRADGHNLRIVVR